MITYNRSAFGLNIIFRLHGSAVYRAIFPSLVSVAIYMLIQRYYQEGGKISFGEELGHPYAIGALVASASFLVVFRANQGYARYWEGASSVTQMMSKWLDATTHTWTYHLQCDHYKKVKPPSFFDYPDLNHLYLTRDRERGVSYEDVQDLEDDLISKTSSKKKSVGKSGKFKHHTMTKLEEEIYKRRVQAVVKSINKVDSARKPRIPLNSQQGSGSTLPHFIFPFRSDEIPRSRSAEDVSRSRSDGEIGDSSDDDLDLVGSSEKNAFAYINKPGQGKPTPLFGKPRLDGNLGAFYTRSEDVPLATFANMKDTKCRDLPPEGFASVQGGRTPHLFLQELAHLSSLLTAVALSTLRNDIDGAESPLTFYDPGSDWPTVDPDKDEWMKMSNGLSHACKNFLIFLGMGRSPEEQTRYNAGRPLPVIGGVSDAEIRFLQMARGRSAKTQLCWSWLSEYIIREHLAGSLGKVGPPIVSRIIQFLGDGMIYYNHARKIMFIPFPFVHAQLSVLFIVVIIPVIPFLMEQYTEETWIGATLTFFTVLCLAGVNEVARELENPFRNVPNELPLVTFQAQYNEALVVMYSGFHPDHYWDGDRVMRRRTEQAQAMSGSAAQHAHAMSGSTATTESTCFSGPSTPREKVREMTTGKSTPLRNPASGATPTVKVPISNNNFTREQKAKKMDRHESFATNSNSAAAPPSCFSSQFWTDPTTESNSNPIVPTKKKNSSVDMTTMNSLRPSVVKSPEVVEPPNLASEATVAEKGANPVTFDEKVEIDQLRKQLEQQGKLIEQLFAKLGPVEDMSKLLKENDELSSALS